ARTKSNRGVVPYSPASPYERAASNLESEAERALRLLRHYWERRSSGTLSLQGRKNLAQVALAEVKSKAHVGAIQPPGAGTSTAAGNCSSLCAASRSEPVT